MTDISDPEYDEHFIKALAALRVLVLGHYLISGRRDMYAPQSEKAHNDAITLVVKEIDRLERKYRNKALK